MNKEQLIAKIATDVKIPKAQAKLALESFLDTVKKTLKKGEKIALGGLGTFVKKHKKERSNPQRTVTLHGVEREIPASITPEKDVLDFKTKVEF